RTGATTETVTADWDTVDGSASAPGDYTAASGSISIASGVSTDTIVITLTDDDIVELEEDFDVDLSNPANATITQATGTATVTDDDTAGVTITEIGGTTDVEEGGATDTYEVVLTSQPTDSVTITVSPQAGQLTTDSGGTLTFDPTGAARWDIAQTVTVTAVDDGTHEADPHTATITHSAASATDTTYDGISVDSVTANITDNDPATVTFLNPTSNAQEDDPSHSVTVRLDVPGGGALLAPLVVDVQDTGGGSATPGPGNDYTYSTQTLTFQTGWVDGWDLFANATIVDDGDQESPETIEFDLNVTSGGEIGTGNTTHTVTIVDDETRNIVLTPTEGTTVVTEGGPSDTFDVRLTQAPTGTVTVDLTKTMEAADFTVSPTSLSFTTGNWMTDKTVTVTAVNDAYDDGDLAGEVTLTASGGGYNGITAIESVTTIDNNTAGVTVTETGGGTAVQEGTGDDTYNVVLDARPKSNVTMSFSYDSDELSLDKTSLVFTTSNWDTAQVVTVTGVADGVAEPDTETLTIQHTTTSADSPFDGLAVASVDVEITNSDELQISIVGPTVGAPGVKATFEAIQNASGTGEVTYQWNLLKNFVDTGISGDKAVFEFTPTEGGVYQIIVVIEDDLHQGDDAISFFIDFTVIGDIGGHLFVSNILWLAEEGITTGCVQDGTSFCPNSYVTRGQMAAFLVRFLDLTDNGGGNLFEDDDNSIFENNIDKLATAGITRGCNPSEGNTKFCPDAYVTRGQMAAFLVRALGLTDDGGGNLFQDDDGSVFESNIDKLATAGITRGCNPSEGNTKFCPDAYVTRGQMAAFLQRASGLLP
ncbi:MAG: hypothetical protein GY722_12355, partial [bacterium]|nr:hypothetical protein [bacterium]